MLYYLKKKKSILRRSSFLFVLLFFFYSFGRFYASNAHQVVSWTIKVHLSKYPCKTASVGGSDELKKKDKKYLHGQNIFFFKKETGSKWQTLLSNHFYFFAPRVQLQCLTETQRRKKLCVLGHTNRDDREICTQESAFSADELSVKVSQVISHCFARALSRHYPPPSPLPHLPLALVYARQGHIITCHSFSALVNCRVNLPTRSDCANWEGHAW